MRVGVRRLIVLALLSVSHLMAAPPDPRAARVDALYAGYNAKPSPGLAVAIVRDGKIILRKGYGMASIEHGVAITPSTVFDTASLAKQFTGMAVAMLVGEGKIRLTDDVRKYIPEFPDFGQPVTIEHLLHHTSGLRDWPGTLRVAGWSYEDVISFRQVLTMAYHQRSLNFTPGAEHLYSNTGYNVLAEVVQRVTGQSFRAWTDEHLFQPLGMTHTHFRDDHTEVIANRAFGYRRGKDGAWRNVPDNLTAVGSSSLFSSVDDFALWLINFDRATVGGKAAVALMQTPGKLNDGTTTPYGFGITTGSYRGLPMFTHSGGWAAFDTYTVYFPQQKLGIVVLANSDSINAQNEIIRIANIYLEKELAPEPPRSNAEADEALDEASAAKAVITLTSTPVSPLTDYAGEYWSEELGTSYRVVVKDGALEMQHGRIGDVPLTRRAADVFGSAVGYLGSIAFQRDAAGRVTGFVVNGDERSRDIAFVKRR